MPLWTLEWTLRSNWIRLQYHTHSTCDMGQCAGFEPDLNKPGAWLAHVWSRAALTRRTIPCTSRAAALALLDADRRRAAAAALPVYLPSTDTLLGTTAGFSESADVLAAAAREVGVLRQAVARRFEGAPRPTLAVRLPAGRSFAETVEQARVYVHF